MLLEQLDLNAWLSLILGRWVLFEPILKKTGRNAVQILKDVYSGWAGEGKFISLREANHVAAAAYDLLTEFDSKEAAKKVGVMRDELREMLHNQDIHSTPDVKDADDIPTVPAIHNRWLGVQETGEKPLSAASNPHDSKSEMARI